MTSNWLPGLSIACVIAMTGAAAAADDATKPAAATVEAAAQVPDSEAFCGDPVGKVADIEKRYSGDGKMKLVDESDQYKTYADDPKNAQVMYNFTKAANPAHPSAICRKIVREGENLTVRLNVVCESDEVACAKLKSDFNVLLARMQAAVNEQMGGAAKK